MLLCRRTSKPESTTSTYTETCVACRRPYRAGAKEHLASQLGVGCRGAWGCAQGKPVEKRTSEVVVLPLRFPPRRIPSGIRLRASSSGLLYRTAAKASTASRAEAHAKMLSTNIPGSIVTPRHTAQAFTAPPSLTHPPSPRGACTPEAVGQWRGASPSTAGGPRGGATRAWRCAIS